MELYGLNFGHCSKRRRAPLAEVLGARTVRRFPLANLRRAGFTQRIVVAPAQKKDFFISYNKADRQWAEWIAWQLEEAGGYSVVIQAWDFGPGGNFVLEMDRAIQECERVVAVLSPDYLTSLFTQPEWAAYFAQDSTSAQRRIVPVRIRECELKGLLAQIVYVDLVGKEKKAAQTDLLEGVKIGRRKPTDEPDLPGRAPRVIANKPRFPGALPDVWNIPHNRNPNFTEPGNRLKELRGAFASGNTASLRQCLMGLGGAGKTGLALEYCYRNASEYAIVWWIRSENPETLSTDYAALAAKLGLPEADAKEQPAIVAAVRDALQHRHDWLLIFDNANAPDDLLDLLPSSRGHVLITSRNPAWRRVATPLPVTKWLPEVAIEFLLKRTGQTDAQAAGEVAQEVDYLPLALEQAGAYIDSTATTLSSYLILYRKHRLTLLRRGRTQVANRATVETTWELAFQQIEKESPAAAALVNLCAFFAPDDIPRDMIVAGADDLPEPLRETVADELSFEDAIGVIRRYSLIESTGGASLSMHRLVQAVARSRLDAEGQKRWAEAALEIVNSAFPFDGNDVRTWTECARLLPHARSAMDFAQSLEVGSESTARLSSHLGTYLKGRAEYEEAKAAYERALMIGEKAFGPDHPTFAIMVNNIGSVLQDLGDLAGAKAAYERALKINEKAFGPDHPTVATRVNNLGAVLRALGDLAGAKAAFERALKIDEKALGPDHQAVAIRVNNLGSVLQDSGDLAGAKAAFERALKIDEKAFGPDHPEMATDVNNHGGVLRALGDLAGAKAAFERALKIDEKAFGLDHPTVANRVNNIGSVLQDLGDLAGARAAYERALAIFRKFLGEDHPTTQVVRRNLESLAK